MATDLFLTKQSIVGLAERVSLAPQLIEFQLEYNSNSSSDAGISRNYSQSFFEWVDSAPEGGIAIRHCTEGGNYLQLMDKFYCILQRGAGSYVFAFGLTLSDDGTDMMQIQLVINLDGRVNNF